MNVWTYGHEFHKYISIPYIDMTILYIGNTIFTDPYSVFDHNAYTCIWKTMQGMRPQGQSLWHCSYAVHLCICEYPYGFSKLLQYGGVWTRLKCRYLPLWIPMRSFSFSWGRWNILRFLTAACNPSAIFAISSACDWLGSGQPATTM